MIEVDDKLKEYWQRQAREEGEELGEQRVFRLIIKNASDSIPFRTLHEQYLDIDEDFYAQVCEEEGIIPLW